ncbi:MAG: glycosyltransferase family 4 protein [Verrucomicrobiota bacterium]
MRILFCSNFFYRRGGDCVYMFALADLLKQHGHQVFFFSMRHPRNAPYELDQYFVDYIDYEELNRKKSLLGAVQVLRRSIFSTQARKRIRQLITEVKPDVAHLQNIHNHLTPSILLDLNRANVPIVWTLHDFKLICPESSFLSGDRICEECRAGRFYRCTVNRCKKGSFTASLMASCEAYAHQWLRIPDRVQRFVAPSRFLRDKFVEFGWPADKISVAPSFVSAADQPEPAGAGYGAYAGILQQKKGLFTLVEALPPDAAFHFLGEGPDREILERRVRDRRLGQVVFTGRLSGEALRQEMAGADYGVLPSQCYENLPLSVLEFMALGKPVIASRIGGMPELVRHGHTGLLFEPGNARDLAAAIGSIRHDGDLRRTLGRRAWETARSEFTAERHGAQILAIYREVIGRSAA